MNTTFTQALKTIFASFGYREITTKHNNTSDTLLILKRQTWLTNRAIAIIQIESFPTDLKFFLKQYRWEIAKYVGFFPFIYELGLQIIICSKTSIPEHIQLSQYVSKINNQWAILQSIYVIDETSRTFLQARTWVQVITDQYQNAILKCLQQLYTEKK